jgi:hypothetical protein
MVRMMRKTSSGRVTRSLPGARGAWEEVHGNRLGVRPWEWVSWI